MMAEAGLADPPPRLPDHPYPDVSDLARQMGLR
jgi:hypothetical protein